MFQPSASLFDRIGGRPALADLLRHFYADVRQHEEIGPIFSDDVPNRARRRFLTEKLLHIAA
ncbi:MAG: hypothetical protein IPN11_15360 [Opitutaceae bacterium]|nr:hypothetical protein [Opitutaceae bacterium]